MTIWLLSIILLVVFYLLITEKLPIDLTGIGIMVTLMVTGILSPLEAVAGFANPAVITVGAMFLISRAMVRSGVVDSIAQKVISSSRGNAKIAIAVTMLIVAIVSAFINNTPVVVLFIPVVLSMSCEFGFSPSKVLIPISYASILAGTCTLIGTSTNIIISDLSASYGYGTLKMFELAAAGVPIALIGTLFLYFVSPKVMPSLANPTCELKDSEHRRYLAELKIQRGSGLIGSDPVQVFVEKYPSIEVLELIRYSHVFYPYRDRERIAADDLLLVKGSLSELVALLDDNSVELPDKNPDLDITKDSDQSLIVELIIPPQSALLGERLLETGLKHGAIIIYDPNFRRAHLADLEELKPLIIENIKYADIVRGSNEDFQLIFGADQPEDVLEIIDDDTKLLIYTQNSGSVKVLLNSQEAIVHTEKITPVSTIGAGDNFNAGIIHWLLRNGTTRAGLQLLQEAELSEMAGTGIKFATNVCLGFDNYISHDFARGILAGQ